MKVSGRPLKEGISHKILIADDDQVIVHYLSTRMRKAGHEVSVAYDAMHAIRTAISEVPDLIILDIHMPGGTGAEVIRCLNTSIKTKQIPILIVSGSSNIEEQRSVAKGSVGFMAKQSSLHRLEKTVAAVLKMSNRRNHG